MPAAGCIAEQHADHDSQLATTAEVPAAIPEIEGVAVFTALCHVLLNVCVADRDHMVAVLAA